MGLDTVELVLQIEQEFEIDIPGEGWQQILTVGDLARCIEKETVGYETPTNFDFALKRVIQILVDDFAIERQYINSSSKIVNDLGLQ